MKVLILTSLTAGAESGYIPPLPKCLRAPLHTHSNSSRQLTSTKNDLENNEKCNPMNNPIALVNAIKFGNPFLETNYLEIVQGGVWGFRRGGERRQLQNKNRHLRRNWVKGPRHPGTILLKSAASIAAGVSRSSIPYPPVLPPILSSEKAQTIQQTSLAPPRSNTSVDGTLGPLTDGQPSTPRRIAVHPWTDSRQGHTHTKTSTLGLKRP